MPTNAALILVLQQPLSPVSPCSHHTATLVTDPVITALAAINPFRYATIPTTKALASYATTSVTIIVRGLDWPQSGPVWTVAFFVDR